MLVTCTIDLPSTTQRDRNCSKMAAAAVEISDDVVSLPSSAARIGTPVENDFRSVRVATNIDNENNITSSPSDSGADDDNDNNEGEIEEINSQFPPEITTSPYGRKSTSVASQPYSYFYDYCDETSFNRPQPAPALMEPQRERFLTAYERLSYELANDRRCQKEITLGRRIGFYQLRSQIGSGNFSQVKLGVHILTREKVAVKIIDKTRLDGKTRRLLSREISSMERLHHPNIVRLYEVIETLSKLYIMLEYASDGELFTRINNQGGIPEPDAKVLFAQIVSAVQHMHDQHVVHRDLKAENVFVAGKNVVKVGDFGFSTNCGPDQTLATFCGSPPYAAPELFRDDSYYGPNVDVWALGILLYFMVVGSLPFRAETVAKLKRCILEGTYPDPPESVSDSCRLLIRGILRPAPTDRYSLVEIRESDWLHGVEFPRPARPYILKPVESVNRPQQQQQQQQQQQTTTTLPLLPEVDASNDNGGAELTEEEVEARRQLEEYGITERHLALASTRQARSSICGIYQIVLHGVEKRRSDEAALAAAATAATASSRNATGDDYDTTVAGPSGTDVPATTASKFTKQSTTAATAAAAAAAAAAAGAQTIVKKRSKVCTVL